MNQTRLRALRIALGMSLLILLLVGGCDRATTAEKPRIPTAEELRYIAGETEWRKQRFDDLAKPDGWASLIGLHWLSLKSHYIGRSERSGIRTLLGPPSLGMVQTQGERVFFVPERGLALTRDGLPFKGRVELHDDRSPTPTVIGFDGDKGRMSLLWRGGRHALRVKHADAPTRLSLKSIDYWDADVRWRVDARFVPHPAGKTMPIASIIGTTDDISNPGAFEFERDGKTYRIEALDEGEPTLMLIIADRTSGHDSYAAGRYLDVARPDAQGRAVIDFNRAYNPPCAFTPFATCPLPPPENRLDLAITAGEKKYRVSH